MDPGRRHQILGLETNEFIVHNNSHNQNASIFLLFQDSIPRRVLWADPGNTGTMHCVTEEELWAWETWMLSIGHYTCFPFASREDHSSKAILHISILYGKDSQSCAQNMCRKSRDPGRIVSQQICLGSVPSAPSLAFWTRLPHCSQEYCNNFLAGWVCLHLRPSHLAGVVSWDANLTVSLLFKTMYCLLIVYG
jgi:hypothetical protein